MLSYYIYFICLSHTKAALTECKGPQYKIMNKAGGGGGGEE